MTERVCGRALRDKVHPTLLSRTSSASLGSRTFSAEQVSPPGWSLKRLRDTMIEGRNLESVEMKRQRHGCFPDAFVWRRRRYRVEAVVRCQTLSGRGPEHRVTGYRFCVRVRLDSPVDEPTHTLSLFQDAQTGSWYVQRGDEG